MATFCPRKMTSPTIKQMETDCQLFPKMLQGLEVSDSVEDMVLNLVLPVSMAGSVNHEAMLIYKDEQEIMKWSKIWMEMTDLQILTGSSAEGLGLPEVTELTGEKYWTYAPDEDVKYYFKSLIVDGQHRQAFARMETIHTNPGYTRLMFNPEWLEKPRSISSRTFSEQEERKLLHDPEQYINNDGYIIRKKVTALLRNSLRREIHSTEKEMSLSNAHMKEHVSVHFSHHGPAITVDVKNHSVKVSHSKDYVVALPCPKWPDAASEWLTRPRAWPTKSQVAHIAKKGCHIVPKGHNSGQDPLEFIISFSAIEKHVAMSLTIYQKRVYMLLKFLYKYHLNKANRGLTTYHLKTTLFRLCENLPPDQWTERNPYKCLQTLLKNLEVYITAGVLPHYFIQDANLIDCMTNSTRLAIARDVRSVQQDCWSIVLQLTEKRRFCWLSRDIHLPTLIQPILSHSQERLSKATMQNTVAKFVARLLGTGSIPMAISLICGTVNCEVFPPTDHLIDSLKAVLQSDTLAPESRLSFNGFLATLYHQHAHKASEQNRQKESEKLMTKSNSIFERITPAVKQDIWIIAEYYNLLSATDRHADIVRHFISHLHTSGATMDLYAGGVYTRVEKHNCFTTDEAFIAVAQINGFTVPSTAYLFYKVYKAIMILCDVASSNQQLALHKLAHSILKDFKVWVANKISSYPELCDEHIMLLLALCEKLTGQEKAAERLFQKAMDYTGVYGPNDDDLVLQEMPIDRLKSLTPKDLRTHPYPLCSSVSKQSRHVSEKLLKYRIRRFLLNKYTHY